MRYVEDVFSADGASLTAREITAENLRELSRRASLSDERRLCELALLADEAARSIAENVGAGMRVDEALVLLSGSLVCTPSELHAAAAEENVASLRRAEARRRTVDQAALAHHVYTRLAAQGVDVSIESLLPSEWAAPPVAYVRNPLADEAYDVISEMLPVIRPVFVRSFKEAAELVRRGEVGGCLLPLEEAGVRLSSVQTIVHTYDCKIAAVTPVFGPDGTAHMQYALLTPTFLPLHIEVDDDVYVEISCPKDAADHFAHLLAAEELGLELYRTDTCSVSVDGEDQTVFSFVFRDTSHALGAFVCYLSLFAEDTSVIGVYKNLE